MTMTGGKQAALRRPEYGVEQIRVPKGEFQNPLEEIKNAVKSGDWRIIYPDMEFSARSGTRFSRERQAIEIPVSTVPSL